MWSYLGNYDAGWGLMGFGMIGMSLFWILLIVAIVVLVKGAWRSDTSVGRPREKTALDILKERYARGEIETEEFGQKRHDLAA